MKPHEPIRGYCMPCYNGRHDDCREHTPGNIVCCACGHFGHVPKEEWPPPPPRKVFPPYQPPEWGITGGWDEPDGAPAPRKRTIRRRKLS